MALQLEGLAVQDLQLHSGGAMYDLHLWLWQQQDAVAGLIWYNSDLYQPASMQRFTERYQHLLAQLTAAPAVALDAVNLLPPEEEALLQHWNDTGKDWPAAGSLLELVAEQARRVPEQIAVVSGEQRLNYAELLQRVEQLAWYLVSWGAQPGDLIAVAMDRTVDLLVATLAIVRTGAAYVPLDPDYPNERLLYMLEQSAVKLLVSQQSLLDELPAYPCDQVLVDRDADSIAAMAQQPLPVLDGSMRMYVIFTSGSTGLPKGVQVTHGCVVNFLRSMAQQPGFATGDRLLAVTTLSFDIAVLELYLPLTAGGTVILAGRDEAGEGERLRALLEQQAVTVFQATPSTWRLLLASGWRPAENAAFRGLCGGEPLPADLAAELVGAGVELWNMYGPTETTVWSTCYRIEKPDQPLLIGAPIANTHCYVVDGFGQRLPAGIPGELWIGGDGVTAGYLGRDDLTAERFLANPWAEGRLYRTGDLVQFNHQGQLVYLNRIDNQVKIRGFRIELGEIEAILARHPAVAETAVMAREYSALDKRLVAYVRFNQGEQLTSTELRRYLRDFLPDYMIPQLLVELERMPLTPNGKIDRKALPDPLQSSQPRQQIAPRTPAEEQLAAIWAEILGTDAISVDSNFFEIGGHSLLAMQVTHRIEQQFGQRLHSRELILNSLEQLAAKLADAQPSSFSTNVSVPDHAVADQPAADNTAAADNSLLGRLRNKLGLK